MIQIIDGYLDQRLAPRGVRVRSDAHASTSISEPSPPTGSERPSARRRAAPAWW